MTEALAPCPFGRAVLAGQAGCALSRRRARGELEEVACVSPIAHVNCAHLVGLLRERGAFALRLPPPSHPLAHAHAMRLQCGGSRALAQALGQDRPEDLGALVSQAQSRWGALADLPFATIVPAMAAWKPRRRANAGGKPAS
jgi:hypothetical protein